MFELGTPVRYTKDKEHIDVVELEWHAKSVLRPTTDADLKRFVEGAGSGVYAFEAWIDAQGTRSIVYIGSTKDVAQRWGGAKSSLGLIGYWRGDEFAHWSDVLDLTL